MKIYTKKGDRGETSLFGGDRVSKDDVRVECYGTFDEVNSTIGLLRAKLSSGHPWQANLHRIQKDMMVMMSHLATPSNSPKENTSRVPLDGATFCEAWIDSLEQENSSPAEYFLLPGGSEISALCHVVRTQIRRAERRLISFMKTEAVHEAIPAYINRLSDLFFMLARVEIAQAGLEEERWKLFLYEKKKE
ncbi:MAG: cob(I)yrinic acid a,c-diamide adenosyltransferase [Chlorobiales bacterium]|jgi:cob(I)alamin adenosyltransferase|nr:cob(I)yrinic acid a,c-diamide adenosyltransferase [Chlorobiales bacterium]